MNLLQLYDIFREKWEQYSDIYLISDTHFDDKELYIGTKHIIRKNSDDYVNLINSKIGKKSILIHLGDVGNIEAVSRLKGYKVLVMGNHDSGKSNYMRKVKIEKFDANKYDRKQVLSIMKEKYPNHKIKVSDMIYDNHMPFTYYYGYADNNLFDEIYTGPLIIGEKLILSHEPLDIPWAFNIHGHVHAENAKNDSNHLNICPDSTKIFEPINFNRLLKSGLTANIASIHRETIDKATKRSRRKK